MFTYVDVEGVVLNPNGTPAKGQLVVATLSSPISNGPTILAGPFHTRTASDGSYRLRVPCTTDQGTMPDDAYLTFTSGTQLSGAVVVPPSGSPVTLASLPAAPSGAGEVATVNDIAPVDGNITLNADDVDADPAGTAASAVEGTVNPSKFIIPTAAAAPSDPVEGECYFDTVLTEIGVYNSGAWAYTGALT